MSRKSDLIELFQDIESKDIIEPMINDVVFLESQLEELRKLPLLKIKPDNPAVQKATPAAKLYKELLQQYNNCIKILTSILRKDTPEEESPLRAFLNAQRNNDKI